MKILQIVDFKDWAIGHLADIVVRHNPHLDIKTIYVHPRDVENHIDEVRELLSWPDIIDLQYWRTASQLLEAIPELREKKLILTHHNQKNLLSYDWKDIDHHVVHTEYAGAKLAEAGYENISIIPYGFDLSYFRYREKEPVELSVGYCGRVVPWKGLKEIAQACYELGYPLKMMGKIDKVSYWEEIPEEHRNNIDFGYMDVPDNQRHEFYNEITIYVGNSGPDHEEGTMPFQEAMACGVPVVTTPSGVAADILEDGENALVVDFGDYRALKLAISELMTNVNARTKIRANAWQTIKIHTEEMMAWEWERLYHKVYDPDHALVSVIIPGTPANSSEVAKILNSLNGDQYPHLEVVLVFDQVNGVSQEIEKSIRENFKHPIKIIPTGNREVYGLAQARNMAAINAQGRYLVFCDSRLKPEPDAITNFIVELEKAKDEKLWVFGDKGGQKRTFVENFSAIRRDYFIRAGMMQERINVYGGMSQELRTRFQWQGFICRYLEDAKAVQLKGSSMTPQRRQDIIKAKTMLWKMGMKG